MEVKTTVTISDKELRDMVFDQAKKLFKDEARGGAMKLEWRMTDTEKLECVVTFNGKPSDK